MTDSRSETAGLTLLGQSGTPAQRRLETFPAPVPRIQGQELGVIEFFTSEFSSFCPVTGQPDFGSVSIKYIPQARCLETKSLKLYLQSFRTSKEFWEALAVVIAEDLIEALEPSQLSVSVRQNPRGGISLVAESHYSAK